MSGNKPFESQAWSSRGVKYLGDVVNSDGLISFEELCNMFNLPRTSFFLYLQLRSALRAFGVPLGTELQTHPIESWMTTLPTRGLVSTIYSQLQHQTQKELPLIKTWTKDLAVEEEDIDWDAVWDNIFHSSKNPNHQGGRREGRKEKENEWTCFKEISWKRKKVIM